MTRLLSGRIRRLICLVLSAAFPVCGIAPAAAQEWGWSDSTRVSPAAPDTTGKGRDCFHGQPTPECRSFMLTELWIGTRFNDPPEDKGRGIFFEDEILTVELGWMVNQSGHDAVGASVSLAGMGDSRLGLNGRYRRWLGNRVALDVIPGVWVRGNSVSELEFDHTGFSGRLGLIYWDLMGVYAGADVLTPVDGKRRVEWTTGARFGSYPATIGLGAGILLFLGYLAALSAAYSGGT